MRKNLGPNLEIFCRLLSCHASDILQAHLAGSVSQLQAQLVVVFMQCDMATGAGSALGVYRPWSNASGCSPVGNPGVSELAGRICSHDALLTPWWAFQLGEIQLEPFHAVSKNLNVPLVPGL